MVWNPFSSSRQAKAYLAHAFNLGLERRRLFGRRALVGKVDGYNIGIWTGFGLPVGACIDTQGTIPAGVTIRAAGLFERAEKLRTGDNGFDVGVDVFGEPLEILALLDFSTRRLAEELAEVGVVVTMGRVELFDTTRTVDDIESAKRFADLFRKMIALCHRLSIDRRFSPRARLEYIAKCDPNEDVQTQALHTLVKHYPWSEESKRASLAVPRKARKEVRLYAAKHLAGLRPPIWEPLAHLCYDPALSDDDRVGALKWLFAVTPPDVAERLLRSAMRSVSLRARALEVAIASRLAPGEPLIRGLLAEYDPDAWVAAIRAIGAFGYVGLTPGLPPLVESDHLSVAIAAAETLGRLGGIDAVEKLHIVSNKLLVDARLKYVAQAAIAQIQARHQGGKGQLSIAAGGEGELAFAGDAGGVALADKTEDL